METFIGIELLIFSGLFWLESRHPAHQFQVPKHWNSYWLLIQCIAATWITILAWLWIQLPSAHHSIPALPSLDQVIPFYLLYSFINYWLHRLKHSQGWLWRYVHYLHHAPAHMETRMAFWRHPIEMLFNGAILLILGKLIVPVSWEVLISALIIEAILESFHHSNIRTYPYLRYLGFVIQLPEMHLLHHQHGLHRWNYSPISFWDVLFGTARYPDTWQGELGFGNSQQTVKWFKISYGNKR